MEPGVRNAHGICCILTDVRMTEQDLQRAASIRGSFLRAGCG